jgi:hypothetical protein
MLDLGWTPIGGASTCRPAEAIDVTVMCQFVQAGRRFPLTADRSKLDTTNPGMSGQFSANRIMFRGFPHVKSG